MVELVPILIDDAVVLNVSKPCTHSRMDCKDCSDVGVAVHNWLISSELKYVIIDLQDEKDVCPIFVQEIIQLRKRLRIPFLFCGVMERPLKVLDDFNYSSAAYPIMVTPEQNIEYMRANFPELLINIDVTRVRLQETLLVARPRAANKHDDEEAEEADL